MIYYDTKKIFVRNISDCLLRISHYQKLGHVVDIWYNNCFLADIKSAFNSAIIPTQIAPFFKYELS